MPWFRLTFQAAVVQDLAAAGNPMAQRLLDKTKWIASNTENLRHEPIAGLQGLHKYAVADWRIFYEILPVESLVNVHAIVHKSIMQR
jgi:mRNA interferase RelE/StbE